MMEIKSNFVSVKEKINEEGGKLKQEVSEKVSGYILGAFGLVAGLAWNEAVKALIDSFFPSNASGGVAAKFIYAVIITFIVVIVTVYITKLLKRNSEPQS